MSRKPGQKRQRPKKGQKARAQPLPNWQPISQVFFLGTLIDDQVDVADNQLALLREGRHKPHVLTDAIMARIGTLFTEMQDFIDLYTEQCARWRRENRLTAAQEAEVSRLEARLPQWRTTTDEVLALHAEMREGTIEKVLAKDDLELGREALKRMLGDLDDRHVKLAARLDQQVTRLLGEGGEEAVLVNLYGMSTNFKHLLDEVGEEGLLILSAEYDGFGYLVQLISDMTQAIHDGTLKVPPDH